jgi:hypothetical protein
MTAYARSWARARSCSRRALPRTRSTAETGDGLGNCNNEIVLQLIRTQGVQACPGSVRFVQAMRAAGLCTGVVSSSANRGADVVVGDLAELLVRS